MAEVRETALDSGQVTYGAFDMRPDSEVLSRIGNQIGSCGHHDDVETAGGGRIIVIVESMVLEGDGDRLSANGRPFDDFKRKDYSLEGGSGGYIYVKTMNAVKDNEYANGATLSVKGGLGIGEHSGGSGGVII